MTRQQTIADAIAAVARQQAYQGKLLDDDVRHLNTLAISLASRFPAAPAPAPTPVVLGTPLHTGTLTVRICTELVGHEAVVREWYKDSVGVGTWGVGVTNKSGHNVDRYKDSIQTVEKCLAVYVWLLRNAYVPDVLKAFAGFGLTEAQFAAALSFHYNTGAIRKTGWVPLVIAGQRLAARDFLTHHYLEGGSLQERRDKEAALFFDGDWSHDDGIATIYPVKKPSYTPDWKHGLRVDIRDDMAKALVA